MKTSTTVAGWAAAVWACMAPLTAGAAPQDFTVSAKVSRSGDGRQMLDVTVINGSTLDVCLVYGWPYYASVTVKRDGKELKRNPGLFQGRPVLGCDNPPMPDNIIRAGGQGQTSIDLSHMYPRQNLSGAIACAHVDWRYQSKGKPVHIDTLTTETCTRIP